MGVVLHINLPCNIVIREDLQYNTCTVRLTCVGVVLHIIRPCNIVIREEIAIQYMYSEAYMRGCCITYHPALQ